MTDAHREAGLNTAVTERWLASLAQAGELDRSTEESPY